MNASAHRTLLSKPGQPRTVLGLDPGSHFGWACITVDPMGFCTVQGSGVQRFPKTVHPGHRFREARRWLTELFRLWSPTCIAYEMVRRHVGKNANVYGGLRGALLDAACGHDLACLPIAVQTAKKRATDNGNASKADMVAAAEPFIDHPILKDDEADALFIAVCGADEAAAWRPA